MFYNNEARHITRNLQNWENICHALAGKPINMHNMHFPSATGQRTQCCFVVMEETPCRHMLTDITNLGSANGAVGILQEKAEEVKKCEPLRVRVQKVQGVPLTTTVVNCLIYQIMRLKYLFSKTRKAVGSFFLFGVCSWQSAWGCVKTDYILSYAGVHEGIFF